MHGLHLPHTFEDAYGLLMKAGGPADIFGKSASLEGIHETFRAIAHVIHPDKNPKANGKAEEAMKRLGELRQKGEALLGGGVQAKAPFAPVTWKSKKYAYTITGERNVGGIAGIFTGTVQDKKGNMVSAVFKVPHQAADNDLMLREAKALRALEDKAMELAETKDGEKIAQKFLMRYPHLLESVRLEEPGRTEQKVVNVFTIAPGYESGWYTLEEIRKRYPLGVSTRIMCFVWNRILEGLTLAHIAGITHCAITPQHVIIHAESHAGNILDWTASVKTREGEKVPYIDTDRYDAFIPDELLDPDIVPTPATDIYMSAWCMVYILGGDPREKVIPDTVEGPIREFLNKCLQPARRLRPQNAQAAYEEFQRIIKGLYGPRKFVELRMP